jgi:ribose transport system substrate-binding protein
VPHPGATYFGPDNYRAGLTAGSALGQHAVMQHAGQPKLLLLLQINEAGTPLQERITGVVDGFRQVLPHFPEDRIMHLDGAGDRERSRQVAMETLRYLRRSDKLLIAAASDHSALGALDALRALRFTERCALVGHDGDREALERIAEPDSPFIGTVAFFPERYGLGLTGLVLRLLKGEQVPPFNYVSHELITKAGPGARSYDRPEGKRR